MRDQNTQVSDISVLYVEDEEMVRDGFYALIKRRFTDLYVASDGLDGYEKYKEHPTDIVITDVKMPNMNGLEMARLIKQLNPAVYILVVSAFSDKDLLLEAIEIGIYGYLTKPVERKEIFAAISNISKIIYTERELKRKTEFIQNILDFQDNLLFIIRDKKPVSANKKLLQFFRYGDLDEFIEKTVCICNAFLKEEDFYHPASMDDWLKDLSLGLDNVKVKMKNFLGEERMFLLRHKYMPGFNDEHIISFTDITELEQKRKMFEKLATTDILTQVYNRYYMSERLSEELERSRRNGTSLEVMMFDLDHFKQVNDKHGHHVGDYVLQTFAALIKEHIRSYDVFARWGGEEFLLLIPNLTEDTILAIAQKLRNVVKNYDFEYVEKITVSIGCAKLKNDDSIETFLNRADEALYMAKANGRDRVEIL